MNESQLQQEQKACSNYISVLGEAEGGKKKEKMTGMSELALFYSTMKM